MSLRDKFFGGATSIAGAKAEFQTKVAQAKAEKELKDQQQQQKHESNLESQLSKMANSLDKAIANAIKKGETELDIPLHDKEDTDFILKLAAYRRIHELCARPDVNMYVARDSVYHRRWLAELEHQDAVIKIHFETPYSHSPDAHLFIQPKPVPAAPKPAPEIKPAPTTAEQVLSTLSDDEAKALLEALKEKRPGVFEAVAPQTPVKKPPTL